MRSLPQSLDRPLHSDGDPYDYGPLPDITFARAIAPDHAGDPDGLVRAADERLMARKRERRQREAQAASV